MRGAAPFFSDLRQSLSVIGPKTNFDFPSRPQLAINTQMPQPYKVTRNVSRSHAKERTARRLLDKLLDMDRKTMELSMTLYNVSPRERGIMRAQSRRLHDALRRRELRSENLTAIQCLAKHATA
jgi:hypothetical protein